MGIEHALRPSRNHHDVVVCYALYFILPMICPPIKKKKNWFALPDHLVWLRARCDVDLHTTFCVVRTYTYDRALRSIGVIKGYRGVSLLHQKFLWGRKGIFLIPQKKL
jgi:hypothetical protein